MKRIFHVIALAAVLIIGGQTASAQGYDKGDAAYVAGDFATALAEYRRLAEQGDAEAQLLVGMMINYGEGVPQDYAEAAKRYRLAAEQGHKGAQGNLGIMYHIGYGVTQANVYAHMWANIAAAQGNENAKEFRDFVAEQMTPEDISKAQQLARECAAKDYEGC